MTSSHEPSTIETASTGMKKDGVAKGVFFNLIGQAAVVASGGLVSILLARHFGTEIFGQWSVAVVYGTFVGTIVEGGLGRVLIRDAARSPATAGNSLGAVLKGRVALSLVTTPIALAIAWGLGTSLSAWMLILLSVIARCLQGLLVSYSNVLTAFEYFRVPNMVEVFRRTGLLIAALLIINFDLSIHFAAIATLFFTVVGTTYLVRLTKKVVKVDYSASPTGYWRDAFWFWLNGLLFWVNGEIALLILSKLAGNSATGINAAAQRLATLILIIPRAVSTSVIPKLFRSAKDGRGLHKQLNATALFLTAIGGVCAVEFWINGDGITHLVYSEKYASAAPALQVYGLFVLFNLLRGPPSWFLTTSDRLRTVTCIFAASALLTVIGNVLLIPRFGGVAAAWVCVASEISIFLCATVITVRCTGSRILHAYGLGLVPGAVALLVHLVVPHQVPWLVTTALVGVLFVGMMYTTSRLLMRGWNPFGILSEGMSLTDHSAPSGALGGESS